MRIEDVLDAHPVRRDASQQGGPRHGARWLRVQSVQKDTFCGQLVQGWCSVLRVTQAPLGKTHIISRDDEHVRPFRQTLREDEVARKDCCQQPHRLCLKHGTESTKISNKKASFTEIRLLVTMY